MKINGAGPGKEDFELALQQYEYSGVSFGMPRYTMTAPGKRCDIFNTIEKYNVDLRSAEDPGSFQALNLQRFNDLHQTGFWKVDSLCYCA